MYMYNGVGIGGKVECL